MKYATTVTFYDVVQHIKSGDIPGFPLQPDARLLILTNFAVIEADLVDTDQDVEVTQENMGAELFKAIINGVTSSRNDAIKEWEEGDDPDRLALINDASYLVLTNATIIPHANPEARFHMGEMLLFTDQIVGFTVGQLPAQAPPKPDWAQLLKGDL